MSHRTSDRKEKQADAAIGILINIKQKETRGFKELKISSLLNNRCTAEDDVKAMNEELLQKPRSATGIDAA